MSFDSLLPLLNNQGIIKKDSPTQIGEKQYSPLLKNNAMSAPNTALSAEKYRGFIKLTAGILLFLSMTFLNGCGSRFPELQRLAPLPSKPPCHIAVLPFINKSNYAQADLIVYKIFMAELLQSTHYRVAQEGDVRKVYRQLRIYPQKAPQIDQLKILADRLNTQLFIVGTILKAQEQSSGRAANPELTLMLELVDATSGKTLWSTYHTREGIQYQKVMHFGLVTTISGVARRMSQEILSLWFREGLQPCTD